MAGKINQCLRQKKVCRTIAFLIALQLSTSFAFAAENSFFQKLFGKKSVSSEKKSDDSEDASTLAEVVVKGAAEKKKVIGKTGIKTNTSLRDVPANVGVVSKETVELQGGTSSLDYAIRNVSGVTQSSGSNYGFFNNYLIRGLNMNFLRDGVPDASTINGYNRSLIDVESIEVLKGPGSALYGSGSPGGSINLISKEPKDYAYYSIYSTLSSFRTYQTTADLTGPLIPEKLSYRFIANHYTTQGFRDVGRDSFDILPTVKWKPNENHEVTMDFDYRRLHGVADTYGTPFNGTSLLQQNSLLEVPTKTKYYTPFGGTEQKILRYSITDNWKIRDNVSLRNNFTVIDRNLFLLRNAGGTIASGSNRMTGRNLRRQTDHVTDYLYQIEPVVDFDTWKFHHKWLNGFELQYHNIRAARSTATLPNILDIYNPVIPEQGETEFYFAPNFDRTIDANYLSVYSQDQMDITEKLKARFGGRIDHFYTKMKNRFNELLQDSRRDLPLSGQVGLVYQLTEQMSFYSGIAKNKQAILSTEASNLGKPEGAVQYEIGTKNNFFDKKLNVDLSWFHVTRTDFLVTVGADTFPVGKQTTEGVDLDASLEPIKGWKINSNYSLQDAELLNVPQAVGAPPLTGNRPTGVPVHQTSLWTTYEIQSGRLKGLGVGGGLTYKSSVFLNQQNTSKIPSYLVTDAVLFYKRGWYEFQINATNLTNQEYFRNGVNSGALPGDPFSVYATVRLHYPTPKGMA